mgnify:CR=1 FL=1
MAAHPLDRGPRQAHHAYRVRARRTPPSPTCAAICALLKPPTWGKRGAACTAALGLAQGYLKTPPEISIKARRSPDNRRPSFEPHEFARLEAVSLSRLVDPIRDGTGAEVRASDGRSWRIKRLNDHTRRDRTVLHAYVLIGAFSGLLPTEMDNLTWGDVLGYRAGRGKSVDDRDIRLQVRGKGKSGKAIPQKAAIPWFDTPWMLFERSMGREPADSDPVFASEMGKRITPVSWILESRKPQRLVG